GLAQRRDGAVEVLPLQRGPPRAQEPGGGFLHRLGDALAEFLVRGSVPCHRAPAGVSLGCPGSRKRCAAMSAVPPVRASLPLLAASALALAGCGPAAPPVAEARPPPVTVGRPVVREVTDYDDFEGRIAAIPKVEVRARVRGHLIKVNFQAGQLVREGQLLYEIDPRPYQAILDAARAQERAAEAGLEFARAEYNRMRMLVAKQAGSREDLDTWVAKQATARADLLKARAAVGQAELDLNFCRITAPFAGQVGRSMVDVGNLVNPGGGETLLTTVVAEDPMYV